MVRYREAGDCVSVGIQGKGSFARVLDTAVAFTAKPRPELCGISSWEAHSEVKNRADLCKDYN